MTHVVFTWHRGRAAQRGFTLIELMISISIGIFLAAGLVTLMGAMKRTSTTQSGLSNLQENERLTMSLIADVIQSAGYWPNPTVTTNVLAFPAVGAVFTTSGQTLSGTHNAAAPGDSISVRFNTGGSAGAVPDNVINCSGSGTAAAASFINTFSLVQDPNDTDPTHKVLQCVLANGSTGATTATLQLANGVTNLQILYGVQTNTGVTGNSVDTYLTADLVQNWGKVMSVKVILTFINPLHGRPSQPATIPFTRIINVMNRAGVST